MTWRSALLVGEYDERSAVIAIRSGAGRCGRRDFAEILLRMYLRWAERRHGHLLCGRASLKSATFEGSGPLAYGTAT